MRFLVVLLLLVTTVSFAQKKKDKKAAAAPVETQQPPVQQPVTQQATTPVDTTTADAGMILTEHFLRKYATAMRWNDQEMAKDALYDIIVENPGNDSLIYNLAYYYYDEQKFASSLLISQDLLVREPKNQVYLEMAGSSAQQLGVYDRALSNYETLYLLNNHTRTLYQIAFLQFNMKRLAECTANVNILLGKADALTEKVVFNDAKGDAKEYPIKVSVLNLKGLVALEQKDKVGAKKAFTEALAISPDFVPAKENMEKTK